MGVDTTERTCPACGADMSKNGDGEWECDGFDCTAHLDAMDDDDSDEGDDDVIYDDDEEDDEQQDDQGSDFDRIDNDPRPREERDIPWSDMPR